MKTLVTSILLAMLLCVSCSYRGDSHKAENEVRLTQINGYFSKRKPRTTEAYVLDKRNFDRYFGQAKVMRDENDTSIDFSTQRAGAIILPETSFDTRIILNEAYVEDSVLYIKYSIHQVLEKRSYRIVPARLFTFDADVPARYVQFEYDKTIIKKPIQ